MGAAALAWGALASPAGVAQERANAVVLVHGAVMDGSGWRGVHDRLKSKGYDVGVVQLPLTSLEADVAATRQVIDQQDGPVVLVGSSYGGAVISVAGTDPKVKALVYVAALQPDAGESVADWNQKWPMPSHPKMVGENAMIVDPLAFHADVAADLPKEQTTFLAASQRPTAVAVYMTKLPAVAWHDKPSYAIVATEDRVLDPAMKRFMYARSKAQVTEIKASHMVHISHPDEVAGVIAAASAHVAR